MLKKLDQLSDMSGKQQKLMDDTFDQQRSQEGDSPKDGKKGQKGKNGGQNQMRQQGKAGDKSQPGGPNDSKEAGQGQRGNSQQQGMQEEQRPDGRGGLKDRQSELRKNMEKLQRDLEELGAGGSERMKEAEEAMRGAEDSLEKGDLEEATSAQGDALDKMRQSAQQMAEQMQKDARQRQGRNTDSRRDPLDRPQRSEGPDLGNSVKVPNAFDAQRAREILEELRKRSGESAATAGRTRLHRPAAEAVLDSEHSGLKRPSCDSEINLASSAPLFRLRAAAFAPCAVVASEHRFMDGFDQRFDQIRHRSSPRSKLHCGGSCAWR